MTAAREIIRGMGFESSFMHHRPTSFRDSFAAPWISESSQDQHGLKFKPITVLDSLIFVGNQSLNTFATELNDLMSARPVSDLNGLYRFPNIIKKCVDLEYSFEMEDSVIRVATQPRTDLRLIARERLFPLGFPIIKDFLMEDKYDGPGINLKLQLDRLLTTKILGPRLLKLMQQFGYRTSSSQRAPLFLVSEDYQQEQLFLDEKLDALTQSPRKRSKTI